MRKLVEKCSLPIAAALLVFGTATDAAIYKSVDTSGNIGYSDRPRVGAEHIELPPLSLVSAEEVSVKSSLASGNDSVALTTYRSFSIIRPADGEILRSNGGALSVEFEVAPALDPRHAIALHIDGEPIFGEAGKTNVLLANLDRGTHSLQGFIVDAARRKLAMAPRVTLHLQRFSILTTPNR